MIITPSILNCNFLKLEEEIQSLLDSGINHIHYDVMDNHFVPNLSFGPYILKQIANKFPSLLVDCHMMVKLKSNIDIIEYIKPYISPNITAITFHYESLSKEQFIKLSNYLKSQNIKLGLAINPNTNVAETYDLINLIDVLLIMSVNPGFGGQKFQSNVIKKIELAKQRKHNLIVQIDGGINGNNIKLIKDNKFDWVVIGSYIFNEKINNRKQIIKELYEK